MTVEVPGAVEILLVEDNPQDTELTLRAFRRRRIANSIHVVEDGVEALDFLFCRGVYAERPGFELPKIVLLDVKLPKLSGLDVLRAIRADERTHLVPVVMVTSSREDPDIKAAYSLGANSYIVKPVDFEAFQDAVATVGLYWLLLNQEPR
jgi:two-component system, response regulator